MLTLPHGRLRRVAVGVGAVVVLVSVRLAVEPRRAPPNELKLSVEARAQVAAALKRATLSRRELLEAVGPRRILLLGESHFFEEPQEFAERLVSDLHDRDGRRVVLLLELPGGMQDAINRYLATGDEAALVRAWRSYDALPYQHLVRWARGHPLIVKRVVAYDEPSARIALMRLFLTDTRNATMAHAISKAAQAERQDRVVAFGGRLHMMKAGRYMYNSPSRSPVGARLRAFGIPTDDVATIWIFAGSSLADGAWNEPGAVSLTGPAGQLPISILEAEAVYGASRLTEVADIAVFLGPATPIVDL